MASPFITTVVEEDGELYIIIPPLLLLGMGWDENTQLEWEKIDDDRWSIQKAK